MHVIQGRVIPSETKGEESKVGAPSFNTLSDARSIETSVSPVGEISIGWD